jgi:hypothetical protein
MRRSRSVKYASLPTFVHRLSFQDPKWQNQQVLKSLQQKKLDKPLHCALAQGVSLSRGAGLGSAA